jgi:hypothetical protein
MRDGGRIVGALFVLAVAVAVPGWLFLGRGQSMERPATPKNGACVEPVDQMRRSHPALLADWRQRVVRTGDRVYHGSDGKDVRISLTGTCLGCHGSAAEFCNKCHAQTAVALSCWQCHADKVSRATPQLTTLTSFGGQGIAPP